MLGFPIHYSEGLRLLGFQLLGFYCIGFRVYGVYKGFGFLSPGGPGLIGALGVVC